MEANAGTVDAIMEPAEGRNPQERDDDPEKLTDGHPMCAYYDCEGEDKCQADLDARLVQHTFPDGPVCVCQALVDSNINP